jgi:hypothetical protein
MRGFWLFLRTRAPLFPDLEHGWSEVRRGTWQFVAAGRRSGFVAKYDSDAALLSAWGAPGACWNLMAALERWKALREAGGGRFTVEVVDDGATADGPNEWLDHRRHVTLRVRFGASGS